MKSPKKEGEIIFSHNECVWKCNVVRKDTSLSLNTYVHDMLRGTVCTNHTPLVEAERHTLYFYVVCIPT